MPEGLKLNTVKPNAGSRRPARRVGRGNSAGQGTTCGRGYKGQKSRSGGYHKINFEGGQMPLQRRLPKIGFRSRKKALTEEVRLNEINNLTVDEVSLEVLKKQKIVSEKCQKAKIILSGEIKKAIVVKGIPVTIGARSAIEAAGGRVE